MKGMQLLAVVVVVRRRRRRRDNWINAVMAGELVGIRLSIWSSLGWSQGNGNGFNQIDFLATP